MEASVAAQEAAGDQVPCGSVRGMRGEPGDLGRGQCPRRRWPAHRCRGRYTGDGGIRPNNRFSLLQSGGTIDATGYVGITATFDGASPMLTIGSGANALRLNLESGLHIPASFTTAPDAAGTGLAVTYTACFAERTHIATPAGKVAVESIRTAIVCVLPKEARRLCVGLDDIVRWTARDIHARNRSGLSESHLAPLAPGCRIEHCSCRPTTRCSCMVR